MHELTAPALAFEIPGATDCGSNHPNIDPTGRFATGQVAFRSTRSDVVPRKPSRNPSGPSVVITIRSEQRCAAACKMMSAGSPALAIAFQVQSVSAGSLTKGISAAGPTWSNVTTPAGN